MYGILTKDYILSKVSQEEIFEYYLNLDVKPGVSYRSTLRKDEKPTCGYTYKNGKIYFKDYSGAFHGDCFDVVRKLYGVSFNESLEIVAAHFGLIGTKEQVNRVPVENSIKDFQNKEYSKISITVREWNESDLQYWGGFYITLEVLQYFGVYAIQYAFLNGETIYGYHKYDPCYAYRFGNEEYKLYFPFRSKNYTRFMTNSTQIQGLRQLPKTGDLLILTKSLKDVMVLRRLGILSVAFQSESLVPKPDDVKPLLERFKRVYSFYDFDLAGVRSANSMRKLYGIKPVFLTNGRFNTYDYGAKDPAEYIHKHRKNQTLKLLNLWMKSS